MNFQNISQNSLGFIRLGFQTTHNRILCCGLLVGFCYLPVWLRILWVGMTDGKDIVFLNLGFISYTLYTFWQQRQQLTQLSATEEERFVGHLLVLGGTVAFFLCGTSSSSLQALIWVMVLVGMAYSSWGIGGFRNYPLPISLLLLSMYADFNFLSYRIWELLTPPKFLDSIMAWLGSLALRVIGQPAVAQGPFLSLPAGAVEVAPGCNGFTMALTIAGASFLMGLFMKQSRLTILRWMVIGVVLALIFNVPRIVILTFASVYWGKASFDFWHGPWGGQIFSSVLFTVYYYMIMGSLNQRSPR
jgi:exosortase